MLLFPHPHLQNPAFAMLTILPNPDPNLARGPTLPIQNLKSNHFTKFANLPSILLYNKTLPTMERGVKKKKVNFSKLNDP